MSSIEATLTASQLRWTGHIIRMNYRLQKGVFYGELAKGKRLHGGAKHVTDVIIGHDGQQRRKMFANLQAGAVTCSFL